VIEALSADAPQKSLADRVHQRRLHGGAHDTGTGARGDAVEDRTEFVVSIPDEDLRRVPEGCHVAKLLRSPRLRWSARHPDVHNAPGVHVDDEEREDGTEPDVVGLQESRRPRLCGFAGRSASPVRRAGLRAARLAYTVGPCASRRGCRASRVRPESVRLPRAGSRSPCGGRGRRHPVRDAVRVDRSGGTSSSRTIGILSGATAVASRA
jgi:hypothetical protein